MASFAEAIALTFRVKKTVAMPTTAEVPSAEVAPDIGNKLYIILLSCVRQSVALMSDQKPARLRQLRHVTAAVRVHVARAGGGGGGSGGGGGGGGGAGGRVADRRLVAPGAVGSRGPLRYSTTVQSRLAGVAGLGRHLATPGRSSNAICSTGMEISTT